MSLYVLRAESLALETCTLSLVTVYILFLLSAMGSHPTHFAGLLLLMAACAYGICATDIEHRFSRKFSRCTAILGALSCVAAVAHIGFLCEYIHRWINQDDEDLVVHRQLIPISIGFILLFLLKTVEIVLAGILAVKHGRIILHQGPRTCTTMVMVPTTAELQENRTAPYPQTASNYDNQPATQPVVGPPAYV